MNTNEENLREEIHSLKNQLMNMCAILQTTCPSIMTPIEIAEAARQRIDTLEEEVEDLRRAIVIPH